MLAFKFFVFVGIVGYVVNSIEMIKQDKSTKNKVSLLVAIILFLCKRMLFFQKALGTIVIDFHWLKSSAGGIKVPSPKYRHR